MVAMSLTSLSVTVFGFLYPGSVGGFLLAAFGCRHLLEENVLSGSHFTVHGALSLVHFCLANS